MSAGLREPLREAFSGHWEPLAELLRGRHSEPKPGPQRLRNPLSRTGAKASGVYPIEYLTHEGVELSPTPRQPSIPCFGGLHQASEQPPHAHGIEHLEISL